jgi:hypothetical protein
MYTARRERLAMEKDMQMKIERMGAKEKVVKRKRRPPTSKSDLADFSGSSASSSSCPMTSSDSD